MNRIPVITLLIMLTAGIATAETDKDPVLATDKPVTTTIDKVQLPEEELSLEAARGLELRNAMNEEIALRMAAEKTTLTTMALDLERAVTTDDRLATQRRISAAKQAAWRDILGIQLKYANLGGFTEQAAELEKRIARLNEGLSQPQPLRPSTSRDDRQQGKGGK